MTRQPSLSYTTSPKRQNKEAALQRAVVQHLRLRGVPGLLYLAIKNEGRRSAALGLEFIRQGMRPGAADLLIIIPDRRPLFLELKAAGGKLSPAQIAFQSDCFDSECHYELASSIDEALEALEEYGALKAGRKAA